jgi:iron-sulfur cluster assembly protein
MLMLTTDATHAIRDLIDSAQLPDTGGLRMDVSDPVMNSTPPAPDADDQVIDEGGVQVFLSEEAAGLLDDKELDAQAEGGQVTFIVHEQQP